MAEFKEIETQLNSVLQEQIFDVPTFLDNLELTYLNNSIKLAFCFDYILKNSNNYNLLDKCIRRINKKLFKENLSSLIDLILRTDKSDDFCNIKVIAIKVISNYKDKQAVPSLLYCLNNKQSNYKIRLASAEALGKIGDKIAFESLGNIAKDTEEKSSYVKESAVVALGMLGDKRALDVFDSIIETKEMFLSKFSYLKERIIEAISKFDIKKEEKALHIIKKSLLDNSKNVRISAIEALMNSDYTNSYELIYDRLINDDDEEVKKNALIALYNISDEKILKEVLEKNFSSQLKEVAKEILESEEE